MGSDGDRTFQARMMGLGAETLTLGGVDIASAIGGVDIYLRPNQTPEVVIRPVLGTTVDVELSAAEGKQPKYIVAPDVGMLLMALGWVAPESWEVLMERLTAVERAHFSCGDRMVTLEQERDHHQAQAAKLDQELANAQGRIQDLEMAHRTAEDHPVSGLPYDTTARSQIIPPS